MKRDTSGSTALTKIGALLALKLVAVGGISYYFRTARLGQHTSMGDRYLALAITCVNAGILAGQTGVAFGCFVEAGPLFAGALLPAARRCG